MDSKYLFGANAAAAIRSQAQKTIKVPSKKTTTAEEKKLKQDIDTVKKKANAEAKPNTVNHIGLDLLRHPEKAFKTELMPAEYIIKDQAGAENTLKKIGDIEKENKNLEEYLKFYKTLGLDQNIKTTSERIKSNEKKLRWFEQAYADWDASVTLQAKKQERARYRKNRRSQEEINRDLENLRKDAYKKGALTSDEVRDLRIAEQGLRKELEWAKAFDYEDLSKRPDFAQKSKFKSTKHGELEYYDWGNVVADTGYDDALYDMINGDESAKQAYMQQTEQAKLRLLGLGNGYLENNLSSDELSTYNYLHALDDEAHKKGIDQNKADEYLKFLADNDVLLEGDLKRRERERIEKELRKDAEEHFILASLESVAISPLKGLGYVGQAVDYLTKGKIDEDAGYNQYSHAQKTIRETVANKWGPVGSFLYQTGMSMADFLLSAGISGGNSNVALAIMGTGAAADATIAAKERSVDDDKAFAIGTIAGAAEILTEKISIDALLDKTTLNKSLFGYWLKNIVAEGSEEVGSDLINLFSDVILSKEKSEWNQSIEKYKEKGMSKEGAFWSAFGEQAASMGLDFMGGAISGGAFAAASIGINTLGTLNTRRKISDTLGENGRETFVSMMPENIDYKMARAAIDFYNLGLKGGNINDIGTESFNALPEEVGNAMIKAGMKDRSIAKAGNAVYNDSNARNTVMNDVASGELDSEGAPIYARTRKEANIEGTDFSKLNKTRKQADIDFKLEKQESVALTGYINTTFARLNKALNAGIATEADLKKADSISSALKKFPTYDGRTYRNLRFESDSAYNDFLAKYAKGKKVTLEAFTSTSKRPNGYPIFEGRVVHMVIDGQTGADIADTYGLPRQQEVIYLPGTEIEITNISTANDGNPIIYAQEAISNGVERNNENSRPAQSVDTNRQKDRGGKTLDSGYGGRNREIHADSWDNTGGNGVLSERRPSDSGGRSLQRGRADRITANDTVQTRESGRNKMFGQHGTEVFDGFTSEQRSNPEFVNAMALFYNAGNKGTSVNDISEQYRFVGTQEQREAMYKAGIADAARSVAQNGDVSYSEITEKGGNVNEEKTARYGRGQERTPGVAPGGQSGSVEAGAGSLEAWRPGGNQAERAVSIRNRADAAGIVSRSTQAQGISIGTDNKTLKVLPSNLWDDEIRTVVREKAQSGIQVVPFVGQLECTDKSGTFTANGWMSPDGKRMYVRADHDTLTMKQISDHEEYHFKALKDKRLDAKLKKQLAKKYGKGWEKFLSRAYAEIYFSGQDMDKSLSDYILQEILADAYAGIDVLRNVENVPMRATDITAQVRETADRVKSRGPPIDGEGRFSRDLEERRRALRKGEMVNSFRNKVNWPAYYNKLNSVEFNSENYDDGDRTIMRLGGQLLTLEMQRNGEFSVVDIKEVKYETDAENYERDAGVHAREKLVHGRAGNDDWRNRVGTGRESDGEKSVGHSTHSADTKGSGESRTADYKAGTGNSGSFSREGSLTQEQVDAIREDSLGRKLTEAQQEFFKNSKVRDDDGKLMVVYHGTDSDFTVFDRTKGRMNMDINGMFFSPYEIDAAGYGGNVSEYYLDIKHPASESQAYKALNMFKGQNNAGVKAREYLESKGYDGVIGYDEVIIFNSEQVKRTDNLNPTSNPDTRFSREADLSDPELQKRLTALLEEYGAIKPGENPFRNIEIPQRTEKDNKVSQTVRTILEAKATPDEVLPTIESLVAEGAFSNEVYTDKKAMRDAEEEITEKGYTRAFADWSNKSSGISKRNTAIGFALYNAAVNSGDVKTAIDVLDTMVRRQHDAAQAVQATRILKKLTPEGQLYSAVRSVQNIESELRKKYGAKAEEIKVNSELAEKFLNAKDEDARNEAMTEIWRDVGRQLPSTFRDKWNAWRYLAMLGNPRTHVRNIAGNAFFAPLVAAKDMIATGIESAVDALSKNGIERQKAFVGFSAGDRALFSATFADFKNVESIALGEGKYSEGLSSNKAIEEGRKIFKFKPLEAARKGNSKLLDVEDKLFSRPHYAYAMSQYCKANGISAEQIRSGKGLENARSYAIKEAQKATYRDTNAFSEFISGIGRFSEYDSEGNSKTAGKLGNLAVEGVLPFRKTPANILVRAAEYSPAQLIRVLASDISKVKQGKMGAAEMIDHISSGLVGTGILALGAFLASLGLVVGHGGGDDEERENAKRVGKQNYALLLPDGTSYTLDWLAPESIPFFIGVNIVEEIRTNNGDADMSSILSAISNATEPMIDMSCLQGLNDLLDNIGYAKSNGQSALTKILAATATSYFGQVVPTLLGQINRTMQDKRYTTFNDKNNKYMTSDMQYTLGKYASKIPGLGFNQVPYIDAWGNEQKTGNVAQRAFNNLINPGYVSESKETKVDKELLRLYRKTGETPFPSRAKSSLLINDAQVNLTAPEYVKYAKEKGQTSYRILDKMIKSDIYKESEDIDKVKLIEAVYDYANQEAKSNVSDFTPSKWVKKVMTTTAEYNIPEETYIMLYKKQSEIEGIKDKNGETIENSRGLLVMQLVYSISNLSDRQRKALFEDFGVGKKIRHYNKALVNQKLKRYSKAA